MDTNTIMTLPFIPLRGIVVYPKWLSHVDLGREQSLAALDAAMEDNRYLIVATQIDPDEDEPSLEDVYDIGTLVQVDQVLRLPGDLVRVMLNGIARVQLQGMRKKEKYIEMIAVQQEEIHDDAQREEALRRTVIEKFVKWADNLRNSDDLEERAKDITEAGRLADFIASRLPISYVARQQILETMNVVDRLELVRKFIDSEIEIAKLEITLNREVREKMDQQQKEYYLREKIKVIHQELGDTVDRDSEIEELRSKIAKLKLPKKIEEPLLKEVSRLDGMSNMMAESAVVRTYLDWVLALPWKKETRDRLNLQEARNALDEDHYGLEKVKERIIEYLAVKQLTKTLKGPILCLVGPPGTGKTSIARSIARAMNRKYVRISLGGVRDEADIRGHRRTYIGALPGRIIAGLKQVGVKNPVFLLDEIDKMTSDFRGDPSSALLEVLDPEQNNSFVDHFIDLPFDLSKVFWITTANVISDIPNPLRDRMEIIEFSSYTEEEKVNIAKKYLVPKQIHENGLTKKQATFSDAVLHHLISGYTREAGVRNLEKTIGAICRKVGKSLLLQEKPAMTVSVKNLEKMLGPVKFRSEEASKKDEVGRVTGMAWTQVGGVILETEAVAVKGKGGLTLTGQLGDVMKESARAGVTYIRSRAKELGIDEDFYKTMDLHIHLPEGAIPKDGPSAGITMATALASTLSGRTIRHDVAMTGEITLRGNVLPVGGIKEKVIAAHQAGIKKILLPMENKRDMRDIPESVKKDVDFVFVKTMDEVLAEALV
ncbi:MULTISPECIES: endopeptidase La [Megasphaera]|uniref:Lon protease n=1 Tax=Megasphaera hutchinsoni TaxID=1588748 RepID=A0A134CF29_9FIRM|nr:MULTISPECIES: endopeptidase La [Megasphaera]EGS35605.1 endopeptidase La [Megasphaera sp. UPII 135-E]KXB90822.1 endopeptidase La [Megasphaera hutchinsoni]MUP48596.1 endopeptidase La [Veillonellaceae bacterium M2-8]MUP59360.1 endopeptidase La [Veillonellaceae bacterium M2-4]